MRRIIFLLALFMMTSFLYVEARALDAGLIRSASAVLMDYDTGQILFEKDMHAIMYPASTTKIMTALLAAENAQPSEVMTVSWSAIDIAEPMSSNIALTEGEELTVEDAILAMMMHSANDASNVLAEHIAGSKEDFAALMTQKAHRIGAVNTVFANAHGLHEAGHYTTAYDLALITRHASGDSRFMQYFGRDRHTMPPTNMRDYDRLLSNYQIMVMDNSRFYDPGVLGGKTGFTTLAAHTMSTIAERNGRTLVCVVMLSHHTDDKYYDTRLLLDFGFEQFEKVIVTGESFTPFTVPVRGGGNAEFYGKPNFSVLIHRDYLEEEIILSYNHPEVFDSGDRLAAEISYHASAMHPNIPAYLGRQEIIGRPPPQVHSVMLFMTPEHYHAADESRKIIISPEILWAAIILFAAAPFLAHAAQRRKRKGAAYAYNRKRHISIGGGTGPVGVVEWPRNNAVHTANGKAPAPGKNRAAVGPARDAARQGTGASVAKNQNRESGRNSNGRRHA